MRKSIFVSLLLLTVSFLWAQERPAPIVSPEITPSSVIFRFRAPEAKEVKLRLLWHEGQIPMAKDASGVWSVTIPKPSPELYTYNFVADGIAVNDPANVEQQRDGSRYMSIFIIDDDFASNYKVSQERSGDLHVVWYDSPTLKIRRRMLVYTPYGYEGSAEKFPVLYLLHGGGGDEEAWADMGRTCQIMDNLIAQGKAKPMLVVMPNGNANQRAAQTLKLPLSDVDMRDPQNTDLYINSIENDIVPYIEENYWVEADPAHRALAGLSMGGGHTFSLNFSRPGIFSQIGIFSSGVFRGQRDADGTLTPLNLEETRPGILSNASDYQKHLKLFYMSCGETDDRLEGTNLVIDIFRKNGYDVLYETFPGGHEWSVWRRSLIDFVPKLFR